MGIGDIYYYTSGVILFELNNKTTILLEKRTRDQLKQCGVKGQSYDDVIRQLMDVGKTASERSLLT